MSRSYRKNVFSCIVCLGIHEMKRWRTKENRRVRHSSKQAINTCLDYDNLVLPVLNDFDTMWGSPQDGRKIYKAKPLANQCEVDLQSYIRSVYRWHSRPDLIERCIAQAEIDYAHGGKCCECYSNKRSWYWKAKRK